MKSFVSSLGLACLLLLFCKSFSEVAFTKGQFASEWSEVPAMEEEATEIEDTGLEDDATLDHRWGVALGRDLASHCGYSHNGYLVVLQDVLLPPPEVC